MAPEVIQAKALDPRTDLYSLGIMAFELLAGRRPFEHHDVRELFMLHVQGQRPRVETFNPDVPAALDDLIHRLMAKSAADRSSTAEEVLSDLSKLTDLVHESDLEGRHEIQKCRPVGLSFRCWRRMLISN